MRHIFINNQNLINIEKIGRKKYYLLKNGEKITNADITTIQTKCPLCCELRNIKKLHHYNLKNITLCSQCQNKGENNPFFGMTHNEKTKKIISSKNKGKFCGDKNPMFGVSFMDRWISLHGKEIADKKNKSRSEKISLATQGKNNPFYGKKHTNEIKSIIKQKVSSYYNNMSLEDKKKLSNQMSDIQKKLYTKDPKKYINDKKKAAQVSLNRHIRYKINKIETIVLNKIKEMGLDFEYSVILDYKQFDFGSKKYRILLEVQGDYWHGNPKIYKKTQLNNTQKRNIQRDKEKIKFADKHNMKLYHIWESDIIDNNFSVLEEIKNEIYARTNK
jgi:G:T-mismatch repair DNA endonuclease (very short patch repair protein)